MAKFSISLPEQNNSKDIKPLKDVFEVSPLATCILHPETHELLYANAAARKLMTRMSFVHSGKKLWQQLITQNPNFHKIIKQHSSVHNHEICWNTNSKKPLYLTLSYEATIFHDQEVHCLWLQDITQYKRQEEQFAKAEEQTKQLEIAKEEASRMEKYLHDAVDTMSDIFTLWDKEGRLIVCNEKLFELHPNYRDIYVLGRTLEEIMRTGFEKGKLKAPKGLTQEEWIKHRVAAHKNGSYKEIKYMKGRWLRIRDQYTARGHIVSTAIDITDLKEKEEELQTAKEQASQAEEYLRDALDTMSDGFTLWDKDDRLMVYNKKLFELHPQSRDLFALGDTYEEITRRGIERGDFPVPDGMTNEEWIKQRVTDHKAGNYTNIRYVNNRWLLVADQHTARGNKVTTAVDITSLKEKEQQLKVALKETEIARARAQQATEEKSKFLRTMSHEIRTPLQGIIQMSQLLMTSGVNHKQHEKLMAVLCSSESLLTILNDSLDIARIEAGKSTINRMDFDLKQLIEGVMVLYTLPIQEKKLAFSYVLDPKLPRFLKGDAQKIRQILINFIQNAVKFTEKGGIHIRCDVQPSQHPDRIQLYLAVDDTGPGISEEAKKKLFKDYGQTDETRDAGLGGAGLGLSICQQMVDALGGEIGVDSEPCKGSTFWATLDDFEPTERNVGPNWFYGHKNHTNLPSLDILLVEDNKLNQESTREVLEHLDHKVTIVPDGKEALREIKKRSFDLIISDLQMNRMGGLELTGKIRVLPSSQKDIPIIILTAMAFKEDADACLKAGANKHLAKPIPMWGLQQEMAKLLGYYNETEKTKEESERNAYYRDLEHPDDLQLVAVDQTILKSLHEGLDDDGMITLIEDYQQGATKILDYDLPLTFDALDYDKAYTVTFNFRCLSDTLGLKRLVAWLNHLEIAIKDKDADRISDYYIQAWQEFQAALPILKSFFEIKGHRVDGRKQKASHTKEIPFHGIKTLYVLSQSRALGREMQEQLKHYGYEVKTAAKLTKLQTMLSQNKPFLLMIDLSVEVLAKADLLSLYQTLQEKEVPCYLIACSDQDGLTTRRKAVQIGAKDFYTKPIDYSLLVDKLDSLTLAETTDPYRVLIVDDEPNIAKYHSITLQKAGMITESITDPLTCIEKLYKFQPDIVLMDINMPGCNGVELSHIIRQHQAFVGLPITFLSGEKEYAQHLAAMQGGGDEFLCKPIDPKRLVETVTLRVERLRKIRSLMIRDSLTGLLNHGSIKDNLATQVALAERQENPLSFALIDIDKFKSVNDTYGHPVGDRIIKALSRYLKKHLRRTDIVGRYGGEEFAIILPDTPGKKAKEVIDKIREGFGALPHAIDKQKNIQVTFSAGIATYPDIKEWSDIIKTSDEQLYEAKKQGRNCSVLHEKRKD